MSGIFGIVDLDGRAIAESDLEAMRAMLAHRGPDGYAVWHEGAAGFGHLMLHSTPESLNETLPWRDPASGLVITADARIDNRAELARLLRLSAPEAAALADSALILAAYRQWGAACVERLLGDFVFAIWNPVERRLFCARDHMGVRPFYYFQRGGLLVFASSAQAVAAMPRVPAVINEERVADFLAVILEGVNNRCTFFKDVWRLPPASTGEFSSAGFESSQYWQPDPEKELLLGCDEDYVDALAEVLGSAVEARLSSHQPPAAMLSGGIDSSTIVGLARDLMARSGQPLRTVSGVSDDESSCRESSNIRHVITQGGLEPHVVRPSEIERLAPELGALADHMEDPFDSQHILLALMYFEARRSGSVVVLDGLDGDGIASLTSGYPSYLLRAGRLISAHREIRGQWKHVARKQIPLWRLYLDAAKPVLAPASFWKNRWEAGYRKMARTVERESFVSAELAREVDLVPRFREYYSHRTTLLYRSLRHAHADRIVVPYLTAAVERYGRLAAYCGVEQRHPLLDRRVVEFFLSLPWRQNVRGGWSKFTLRRLAERVAPREVAWREGADHINWKFNEAWRNSHGPTLRECADLEGVNGCGYVDLAAYREHLGSGEKKGPYGENGAVVFYLIQWLGAQQQRAMARLN